MAWSKINKAPLAKSARRDTPEGLWQKCVKCGEIVFKKEVEANQNVCPLCGHHYLISAYDRLSAFLDAGSFKELDANLTSSNPLSFVDQKPYAKRLIEAASKAGSKDAIICGEGLLYQVPVQVGVYNFAFMGGSMGAVVGEKIARVLLRAKDKGQPAILFSASGGARMQEGLVSLMQMAKTCVALAKLRTSGTPMISVLTNPTTGGVAASYAMLGDINIAEPGALIGFAGPRVIQQTIGEKLPEGFQTSEYLLEHGMIDLIAKRHELRERVGSIIKILMKSPN